MADRPGALGPVQVLVIAFGDGGFDAGILDELRRLRAEDAVRLLDLLFVAKDEDGEVVEPAESDLSAAEAAEFGALVSALIGDGGGAAEGPSGNGSRPGPEGVWFLADAIPAGASAAVALIEHRWAIPLRDAIESAPGHDLVDRWIHPEDLSRIGARGS
jgi:hypothetical protein